MSITLFLRNFLIALSRNAFMKRLVTSNFLARRVARRFVAGETWEDASLAMDRLMGRRMDIALTSWVKTSTPRKRPIRLPKPTSRSCTSFHERGELVCLVETDPDRMDLGEEICLANLERVLAEAARSNTFVRVDMEGSQYTELTCRLVEAAAQRHSNIGIVIQAYLRRSREDVARMNSKKIPVRLCKGAYSEPPTVAFQKRSEVNANYIT